LEGPSAGYGIVGSLYRAGPVPFIQRIVNAESYEQAVLKYMAQEGCDRIVSSIVLFWDASDRGTIDRII
jgi:hypothetical protein